MALAALRLPDTEAARAALLLAALGLPGVSSLVGAPRAADGAERLVRHFGGRIEAERTADGRRNLEIAGLPLLGARTLSLAGAPELAVFAIVAGLIVPHSDVLIENVLVDAGQNAMLSVLLAIARATQARRAMQKRKRAARNRSRTAPERRSVSA